jgi:hypothetical protein
MKTWIILGLWPWRLRFSLHGRNTSAKLLLIKKSLDQHLIHLYQSHPDWTIAQIANQVACGAARDQGVKFLVVEVIVLVLVTIIFAIFGAYWWYLAAAFSFWLVGIIGGVALKWL